MLDKDTWERKGRGSSFQFYATDDEIVQVLETVLPTEYAPYNLIALPLKKVDDGYRHIPIVDSIRACPEHHSHNIVKYFLWSRMLTPELPLHSERRVESVLPLYGLIEIVGSYWSNRVGWFPTIISFVEKYINCTSGEMLVYTEYASIYRKLKKAFRSIMAYTTIWETNDMGKEDRSILISEGVAERIRAGEKYWGQPGSKIR